MNIFRIIVASSLIVVMSAPAIAGDLRSAIARTAAAQPSAQQASAQPAQDTDGPMPKGYLYLGSGLFAAGLATALVGFLNNKNGSYPEFGEATSTNIPMGAAGLATAFAGGTVLFLGKRKGNSSASVTFGGGTLAVSKRLTW